MKESTSKEKVLKKVRQALLEESPNPYTEVDQEKPIYHPIENHLEIAFAEEFTKVGGNFVYCENQSEFGENLRILIEQNEWEHLFCIDDSIKKILDAENIFFHDEDDFFKDMKVGITGCEFLIARLGSVVVSSQLPSGRRMVIYPPVHIVLAYTSQVLPDLRDALSGLKSKYPIRLPSQISVITGASRTADIEKTLVMGAHGPKEIYVFLIDNSVV